MKPRLQLPLLLFFVIALLTACSKKDIIEKPGGHKPVPVPHSNLFRITLDSLPGANNPALGLFAIVSVTDNQNQPVRTNEKLALQFDGKYFTDSLVLPDGTYKISKMVIVDANGIARFATPLTNSAKGGLVQNPLTVRFSLPNATAKRIHLQVLKVLNTDRPESFGYPAGAFKTEGDINYDPDPNDPNPYFKIKLRSLFKVGDVVYDSVPSGFTLRTWNAAGEMTYHSGSLAAGTNEVQLPKAAVKYSFRVSRWGITDELTLLKKDIQEGTLYTLGGSKAAKMLKSETTLKLVAGIYKPVSRNVYEYDGNNKLTKVLYYLKNEDNTTYLAKTDILTYNGMGKVDNIKSYNGSHVLIAENSFAYANDGKMAQMVQQEGGHRTTAQVAYQGLQSGTGISGDYYIHIKYQYSQYTYTKDYNKFFRGGRLLQDMTTTSHQTTEQGNYDFDFGINPHIHMNWPDMTLSRTSKHNLTGYRKQYFNTITNEDPYHFEYRYDADGYPTEVITSYKSNHTGEFLYKTKTIYNY